MSKKLVGTGKSGDFVLNTQVTAKDQGFSHVNASWLSKCQTFDQVKETLCVGHAATEDIQANAMEMRPAVSDAGKFVIRYKDGREFTPTRFALSKLNIAPLTTTPLFELSEDRTDEDGNVLLERDRQDAETLCQYVSNAWRRLDPTKEYLFRTRVDGTLRAVLSTMYVNIPNEWYISILEEFVPGGRFSHMKGDLPDNIFANLLIPDTIREEDDGGYAGLLACTNSEIGQLALRVRPGVFRAVCWNGNIWDLTKGEQIKVVHKRKNVDASFLLELKERIRVNIHEQIPLTSTKMNQFLDTKKFAWDGARLSLRPIVYEICKENGLILRDAKAIMEAYNKEKHYHDKTLFCLVNSVTRTHETFKDDPFKIEQMDLLGGRLSSFDESDWNGFLNRACSRKAKDVTDFFEPKKTRKELVEVN